MKNRAHFKHRIDMLDDEGEVLDISPTSRASN
jgi:hypothetical protein